MAPLPHPHRTLAHRNTALFELAPFTAKLAPDMSAAFASPEIRAEFKLRIGQLAGLALAIAALLLVLALVSYNPHDPSINTATSRPPSNWVGLAGATLADLLLQSFGLAAALPAIALLAWAWRLFHNPRLHAVLRVLSTLLALPIVAALLAAVPQHMLWPTAAGLGGAIGGMLSGNLLAMGEGMFGAAGAPLVLATLSLLGLVLVLLALGLTGREWRAAGRGAAGAARVSWRGGREAADYVARTSQRFNRTRPPAYEPAPDRDPAPPPPARPARPPPQAPQPEPVRDEDPVRPKVAITARKPPAPVQQALPLAESGWQFPPVSLLKSAPPRAQTGPSEEALQANARLLESVAQRLRRPGHHPRNPPGPRGDPLRT